MPMRILLAILMSWSHQVYSETITITGHQYAPYYNQNGEGLLPDIWKTVFAKVGVRVRVEILPIKRGIQMFFQNKYDALSPGKILLPEKKKAIVTEVKFFNVVPSWIYLENEKTKNFKYKDESSLRGFKLLAINSSPYKEIYQQHQLDFQLVETPKQMMKMLKVKRADFIELTFLSGQHMAYQLYKKAPEQLKFRRRDFIEGGLAFKKDNKRSIRLEKLFRKGLALAIKDGSFLKVLESYWGRKNVPKFALPKHLRYLGVKDYSSNKFFNTKRTSYGKIISK